MRFTAGDLRGSIVDPAAATQRLRRALATPTEDTPRSAQRAWIEASLRRYYAANRSPDALIGDYRARTANKGTTSAKRSEIANGEAMLQLFLTWEEPEPHPRISMHRRTDQTVGGHMISMAHDLVYERRVGYMVREVWTDGVVRHAEHRRLMQAASLLHSEQLLGVGRVQELEVWHLRLDLQELITLREARAMIPALEALLDRIDQAVHG